MQKNNPQANGIIVAIQSDYRSFGDVIFRSEGACTIKEPGIVIIYRKSVKRSLLEIINSGVSPACSEYVLLCSLPLHSTVS